MIDKKTWDSLTQKAKRFLLRKLTKKAEKKEAVIKLKTSTSTGAGYCCPKCHTWFATPEARKACRQGHLKEIA